MSDDQKPTAKDALMEAARKYGDIEAQARTAQTMSVAKSLAIMGLIELLDGDDPMRDVLNSWRKFDILSFPVRLNREKVDAMEIEVEDFRAAAEAVTDVMAEKLEEIAQEMDDI